MKCALSYLSLCLGLLLGLTSSPSEAAGPYLNTTAVSVTNADHPCTGTPRSIQITVNDAFVVTDLDLGLIITHNWRRDLRATLNSPSGKSAVLIDSEDGNSSAQAINFNIRLDDDDLTRPVVNGTGHGNDPAAPEFATRVRPNSPLSVFDGDNAFGVWTLELCDVFNLDDGTFTRAELIFSGQASSTPAELTCGSSALRHDWDDHPWPAGTLTNSYSDAGEDFRVTVSGATGSLLADPNGGGNTPLTTNYYTGGVGATQQSLFLLANYPNATSAITMTVDIGDLGGGTNRGVGELQFSLFDVDFGDNQFHDELTITGTNFSGASVAPILTSSAANAVQPSGNVARGVSSAAQNSADGTLTVTFLQPVNQITIVYGNGPTVPADPGNQGIALHDLRTCPFTNAVLEGSKSIATVDGGYALPGNDVIYTISVANTGTGATDPNSIKLIDAMPSEIDFFRGVAPYEAVTFAETGTTGLNFDYARDVAFSNAATRPADFSECTYDPVAGYDPTVTFICVNPQSQMAAGTSFDISFRARIK